MPEVNTVTMLTRNSRKFQKNKVQVLNVNVFHRDVPSAHFYTRVHGVKKMFC